MITTYRSPGGAGIRLDGGTTYTGAEVSAHFDSMLAKLTCRGRTFEAAVDRARRALAEFRIRGVATNIPFLQACPRRPRLPRGRRHHRLHRVSPAAADRPLVGRPRHQAARVPGRRDHQPAVRRPAGQHRPGQQAAGDRPDASRRRPGHASACSSSGRPGSRASCAPRPGSRSPTRPSATPTSRCWRPGCAPATCSTWPATSPGPCPSCCRSRPGAARPTTWRSASSPRTRGSGWPTSGRPSPTSACRCCCAAATRSATPPTRPR